jgi:hypothetical protein
VWANTRHLADGGQVHRIGAAVQKGLKCAFMTP